ncbi:MAG: tol-pal system protein YbgF [Hyphomicrobiales bacterium]|nr:tol-pal system protein YbgF [Hyphomicrobiales bacterium]
MKTSLFGLGLIFAITSGANALQNENGYKIAIGKSPELEVNHPAIRIAQANDAAFRVNQLEDQMRRLNGQIEELNFQLLQLQEQIRKMQEDNEFRFQELEGKKQGRLDHQETNKNIQLGKKDDSLLGKSLPSEVTVVNRTSDGKSKTQRQPRMIDGVELYEGNSSEKDENGKEVSLGTITFDSLGNVIDSAVGKPLDLTARLPGSVDQVQISPEDEMQTRLEAAKNAGKTYELGFGYFQSGDYLFSEKVFDRFIERYPEDKKIAKAHFWLGESLFSQFKYEEAAKVFLSAHTNWPDARIAPQALLKLGVSLAAMQQRELACATYVKVYKKYPGISKMLRKRVRDEQGSAHCLNR